MKLLTTLSAAQFTVHLVGARNGIRDRVPVELPLLRGEPENVARDMWIIGSGMSAPWPMLAAHAAVTVALVLRERPWLRRAIGGIGLCYVAGYLLERNVRESFRHPNDRTLFYAIATTLSIAMAAVGLGRHQGKASAV